ncbi:MAG: hypothetical protein CMH46_09155 [Muricauda sp.]|nr:hypothetical protein [Allomuricauda sp.]
MYKQKNRPTTRGRKHPFQWVKRKTVLIISAIMIGMSNAIFDGDSSINGNRDRIEQKENND